MSPLLKLSRRRRQRVARVAGYVVFVAVIAAVAGAADWGRLSDAFFRLDVAGSMFPEAITVALRNTIVYTLLAFVFGLIHGFGFASVLTDLGLPQGALVLSLVGFNLGVEIGQLAIVTVFLPVAYLLRNTWFYRRMVLIGGSLAIALLAAVWFAERAFDLKLLTF